VVSITRPRGLLLSRTQGSPAEQWPPSAEASRVISPRHVRESTGLNARGAARAKRAYVSRGRATQRRSLMPVRLVSETRPARPPRRAGWRSRSKWLDPRSSTCPWVRGAGTTSLLAFRAPSGSHAQPPRWPRIRLLLLRRGATPSAGRERWRRLEPGGAPAGRQTRGATGSRPARRPARPCQQEATTPPERRAGAARLQPQWSRRSATSGPLRTAPSRRSGGGGGHVHDAAMASSASVGTGRRRLGRDLARWRRRL
jgi:hypothetical protein